MIQEVVKGWAVRLDVNNENCYLTHIEGVGTGLMVYDRNKTPLVLPTKEAAENLLERFKQGDLMHQAYVVEVECVVKTKSWVHVADSDVEAHVKYERAGHAYMHHLALLMRDGKVRLTGVKWEMYQ